MLGAGRADPSFRKSNPDLCASPPVTSFSCSLALPFCVIAPLPFFLLSPGFMFPSLSSSHSSLHRHTSCAVFFSQCSPPADIFSSPFPRPHTSISNIQSTDIYLGQPACAFALYPTLSPDDMIQHRASRVDSLDCVRLPLCFPDEVPNDQVYSVVREISGPPQVVGSTNGARETGNEWPVQGLKNS